MNDHLASVETTPDGYDERFKAAYSRLRSNGIESVLSAFKLQDSAPMALPESEAFLRELGYLLRPIVWAAADQLPGDGIDGALIGLCRGRDPTKSWTKADFTKEEVAIHSMYWADSGFPTMTLTAKQFAALSMSDLSDADLSMLRAPWKAFLVRLPDGLRTDRHDGIDLQCRRLAIMERRHDVWSIRTDFNRKMAVQDGLISDLYAKSSPTEEAWGLKSSPVESSVQRIVQLCTHGAMAAISTMNDFPPVRLVRGKDTEPTRKKKRELSYSEYAIGAPVTVDARQYVRDYISSDIERFRKLRWLVRGHWRMQVCGEGRLLRRRKWIEPFWKGPERGTVLIREHRLSDDLVMKKTESSP